MLAAASALGEAYTWQAPQPARTIGAKYNRFAIVTASHWSAVMEDPKLLTPLWASRPDHRAEIETARVGRHERLWKESQASSATARIRGEIADLFERPCDVKRHRGRLHDGDACRRRHGPSSALVRHGDPIIPDALFHW